MSIIIIKIAAGSVAVILIVFAVIAGLKIKHVYDVMTPLPTGEILPGVYALQDEYVNIFLVRHQNGYIAIDSGKDTAIVAKQYQQLQIDPSEITDVYLTHTDYDHAGGLELYPHARVYMMNTEEQMIDGRKARMLIVKNSIDHAYTTVHDSEQMDLHGLTLRFVSLPGHTPGSMGIMVNDRMIFVGDALRLKNGEMHPFAPIFTMDMDTHKLTIEKLRTEIIPEVEYIITAHFGMLKVK